jgi:uncharacterized membrane protein
MSHKCTLRHRVFDKLPTLLVAVTILSYTAFFAWLSALQHDRFLTGGYDLGIFDQTMWNTLHGRILWLTNVPEPNLRLGVHFEPILIPLSLSYLVWSDARTLLLIQTVALALSAIPIYWLGWERLGNWPALGLVIVYLLFPALEGANLFEFHPNTLAVPFLTFAYYYLLHRRYRSFAVYAALAMACREDVSLMIGMMGIYALLIHQDREGWFVLLSGTGMSFLIYFVLIPYFHNTYSVGTSPYIHIMHYAALGSSPTQIALTMITRPRFVLQYVFSNPDKVRYLTHLTAPVAFLALLDIPTLLPALPIVTINLLSNWSPTYALDRFHYSVAIVPFVVFAATNGMKRLIEWLDRWRNICPQFTLTVLMVATMLTSLVYHIRFGHTPISTGFALPEAEARHATAYEMFQLIPPDTPLSAQSNLNPHLSQRSIIYLFPKLEDPTAVPAEYVALDRFGNIFPLTLERYNSMLIEMLTSGEYRVVFDKDGYLLLHRR